MSGVASAATLGETHPMRPRLLAALLSLLVLAIAVDAANWPRFRGPNGTGVAADRDIPIQLGEKDNLLWKVPIPGKGNSSPVIWGDKLFLQSASDNGKERWLLCLDVRNGKTLWKADAPGATAKTHDKNTLASSTPAVDGERVYAAFWDGHAITLAAYSLDGKPLWKQDIGTFRSQHGAGLSPMVHDGIVYLNFDQDGAASLLALDAATGKTVWKKDRTPYRACYSTPFLNDRPDGGKELLVSSTAGITSYEPRTGNENWSYTWTFVTKPLRTVGSPIVSNGMVFACSGDGDGSRHAIAVKLGGTGDVSKSALVWENRRTLPYVPTLLTLGDHIYSVNDAGIAACHVAKTGEEVWSNRLGGAVTASPILVDGKVYVLDEKGKVFVFEAAPKFKLLATSALDEGVMASPAVADGRLFIRGHQSLYCFGKTPNK
jgi:outer membrane protein assembly factor BamB